MENASKPYQNLDQIHQNRRKSSKSWKIVKKSSAKFQSTISNAPKRDQNLKNTQKSQRHSSNAPKTMHFSKNPVLEPRKIARNRGFSRKIIKFGWQKSQRHLENASKPCQNLDQIHQNLRSFCFCMRNYEKHLSPTMVVLSCGKQSRQNSYVVVLSRILA